MRQKEEVGRVVVYILAKRVGAYPGEGAYQSVGAYSRRYGTCSSEPEPHTLRVPCGADVS